MCIDPIGSRLPRFAICSCGASFPACDKGEALTHATSKFAVNHKWTFIRIEWYKELNHGRANT